MKAMTRLLLSFVVAGGCAQAIAQAAIPVTPEMAQKIDAIFATWDKTQSPGCALGISRNGNVVYSRGYGMSNLEYDIAITPDSIFHIASISKQFTAFAIALLASEGKLSLDDDVRRYLPELPDYGQKITLRHLLTHTSGLRDQWGLLRRAGWRPDDVITENDVLGIVTRQKSLNFQPGTEILYSNTGYTLAAVIVNRVSGKSLRQYAEEKIFAPLGMIDTHFHDDHTMVVRGRTSAYEPRLGGGWKISIPVFDTYGATSLFTTVGDLLKWEQNLFDARVGGRPLMDQIQTSGHLNDGSATGYALGLLVETWRGVRTIGHGGADAGYRADAVRFTDHGLAIVALCNLSTINPRILTRKVAEVVLGAGVFAPLPPAVSVKPGELERFVGTYWNAHSQDVSRILLKDGKLMTEGAPDALVPLGAGRFRVGEQTTELQFTVSKSDASMKVVGAPVGATVTFTRVSAPAYTDTDLQAYAGEYHSDELEANYTVSVTSQRGLILTRKKYDPTPLEPVMLDVFNSRLLGTVVFVQTSSGVVTGLTVGGGRVRGQVFTRVAGAVSD